MKDSAIVINGKRYIKSKKVRLTTTDYVYQEFTSADIMAPDIIYTTRNGEVLDRNSEIHKSLREKYALDKKSLYENLKVYINKNKVIATALAAGLTFGSPAVTNAQINATNNNSLISQVDIVQDKPTNKSLNDLSENELPEWAKGLIRGEQENIMTSEARLQQRQESVDRIPSIRGVELAEVLSHYNLSERYTPADEVFPEASVQEIQEVFNILIASGEHKGLSIGTNKIVYGFEKTGDEEAKKYIRIDETDNFKSFNKEIQIELDNIFGRDVKNFSKNASTYPAIQNVFKKRGIEDIQKWFEEKLGTVGYTSSGVGKGIGGEYIPKTQETKVPFLKEQKNFEHVCAHEMAHKATDTSKENGSLENDLSVIGLHTLTKDANGMTVSTGTHLNELVTDNYLTPIFLGQPIQKYNTEKQERGIEGGYGIEGLDIHELVDKMGEELFIEAMFFDPRILEKVVNEKMGDKAGYAVFLQKLDELNRISGLKSFEKDPVKKDKMQITYDALNQEILKIADTVGSNKNLENDTLQK